MPISSVGGSGGYSALTPSQRMLIRNEQTQNRKSQFANFVSKHRNKKKRR